MAWAPPPNWGAAATSLAVLHQKIDCELRPLAFFSRAFNKAQLKYSVFDIELTAIYMAVKHFKYFLEGRSFKIVTDQKNITRAILAPSTNLSPRQSRYIDLIAQYSTDVIYILGSKNVVTDCLSRTQCNALFEKLPPVSLHEMAVKQQADASISHLMNSDTTTLFIETRTLSDSNKNIVGDVSTKSFRPIVPESMRKQVFDVFHSLFHPGIRTT